MADNTKPIPPVPNKSDLLEPASGQDAKKFSRKMNVVWVRWMIQLRDKINLINAAIASLSGFTGTGFISSDGVGGVNGRTIQGTASDITVTNGDGVAGNPVISSAATGVTAGSYTNTNLTVGADGKITAASSGSSSGSLSYAYTSSSTPVSTSDTSIPSDNTIPQITEGVSFTALDTTITPVLSTSLLEVSIYIPFCTASTIGTPRFAVFRDSTANAVFASFGLTLPSSSYAYPVILKFVVPSISATATTFRLRWCSNAGTTYLMSLSGTSYFGGAATAFMSIKEF